MLFNSENAIRDVDGARFRYVFNPPLTDILSYYVGKILWSPNTQDLPDRSARHVTVRSRTLARATQQSSRHSVSEGNHLNSSDEIAVLHETNYGVYIANEPLGTPQWLRVRPGDHMNEMDFAFYDHGNALTNSLVVGPLDSYNYVGNWSTAGDITAASGHDYEYTKDGDVHYLNHNGLTGLVQFAPYEGFQQLRTISGNYINDPNGSPVTYFLTDNGDGTGYSDGGHTWTFKPLTGYFVWSTGETTQCNLTNSDCIRFQVIPGNSGLWRESTTTGSGDPVGGATLYDEQAGTYDHAGGAITLADSQVFYGSATEVLGDPDSTLAPAEFHAEVHFRLSS